MAGATNVAAGGLWAPTGITLHRRQSWVGSRSKAGVNNAGVGTAVPAMRETPEQSRDVIDVNLNGCYWMTGTRVVRDQKTRSVDL
jgi:NAD(P)-dependent dehydrogenase (short-subunit alcohol dehydrogenase family)